MIAERIENVLLFVIFVITLLIGVVAYRSSREAVHTQAQATADKNVVALAAQQIASRDHDAAIIDAALAKQAAHLTSAQAPQVILKYLPAPAAGQPIPPLAQITQAQRATMPADAAAALPSAPGTDTVLTEPQTVGLGQQLLGCTRTANDLTTCAADKAGLMTELAATKAESATWERAAKGGSRLHRILHAAKIVGCAAGGAAVGHYATKDSPTGPAVGAAGAALTCALF